jgi:hypothetical protein
MMILKKRLVHTPMFGLSLLILSACAQLTAPADTGISGQVLIGPTCPMVQDGKACPDQPYQASIRVLDQNGFEVTTFQTDAEGRFKINLAAGTYTLRPLPPQGMPMPSAADMIYTVVAGQFTQVDIRYDSGIR